MISDAINNKKTSKYRPDIDGLRAVAILLVIIFHGFPNILKGGFIGVDIFFVISGYLISKIILQSLLKNNFSYLDFYKRRIKRIFPALIIVLISFLFLGWFVLFSEEYKILGKHVVGGAVFILNILYWKEAGYFDISSSLKPFLHLWSLGVEEQFYIIWPILLVFLYKKTNNIIRITFLFLIVSLLLNILVGKENPEMAFYLPITRLWELMSGALLAQITLFYENLPKLFSKKLNVFKIKIKTHTISIFFSITGLLLLITSLFVINENNFYQGWVILTIIGTFLLIASEPKNWINKKILSNKFMVFIGLISYPLYLWHWSLFSFANIITSESVTIKLKFVLILISVVLSWVTYRWIERPIRFGKIKNITTILCLSLFFVGVLGLTVYLNNGFKSRLSLQEDLLNSISIKTTGQKNNIDLCKKMYPQKIVRDHFCYISGDGSEKIFIIGDSHTRAIYTGYNKSLSDMGYMVINRGISGCPGIYMNVKNEKICNNDIEAVMESIIIENPAGIIISNNYNWVKPDLFEKSMNETISYFSDKIPIVWILQTPRVNFNLMKCIKRPFTFKEQPENCVISRKESEKKILKHNEIIKGLKEKYPNLITIDPYEILCDSENCFVTLDNQFLYEDNLFHLSIFGSHYLATQLPIDQFFEDLN